MYVRSLAVLVMLAVGLAAASTVEDDNLFYGWSNEKDDVVADIIAARLAGGVAPSAYAQHVASIPTPVAGPLVGGPQVVVAHPAVVVARPAAPAAAPAAAAQPAAGAPLPTATVEQAKEKAQRAIEEAQRVKQAALEKIAADKQAAEVKAAADNRAKEVAAEAQKVQEQNAAAAAAAAEQKAKEDLASHQNTTQTLEHELDTARAHAKDLAAQLANANAQIQRTYDEADQTRNAALAAQQAHNQAESTARLAARAARETQRQEQRKINDANAAKAHEEAIKAINDAAEHKKTEVDTQFGSVAANSKKELDTLRGKIQNLRETILQKKAEEAAAAKLALEKKLEDAKASVSKFESELATIQNRKAQPQQQQAQQPAQQQQQPQRAAVIVGGHPAVFAHPAHSVVVSHGAAAAVPVPAGYFRPVIDGAAVRSEAQLAAMATAIDPKEGLKVAAGARRKAAKRAAKLERAASKMRAAHAEAKQIALEQFKAQLKAHRAQAKAAKAQRKFLRARSEEAVVHNAVRATTRGMVARKVYRDAAKAHAIAAQFPAAYADASRAQSAVTAAQLRAAYVNGGVYHI